MGALALLAPALHRAWTERGIVASTTLALPGMDSARLRARLALDGDMLIAIETGRSAPAGGRAKPERPSQEIARLLAADPAPLAEATARLSGEIGERGAAMAAEARRLAAWLRVPQLLVLLAVLAPTLQAGLLEGGLALLDWALGGAQAAAAAFAARFVLRRALRLAMRRALLRPG